MSSMPQPARNPITTKSRSRCHCFIVPPKGVEPSSAGVESQLLSTMHGGVEQFLVMLRTRRKARESHPKDVDDALLVFETSPSSVRTPSTTDDKGFEPLKGFRPLLPFQGSAFVHSANHPGQVSSE